MASACITGHEAGACNHKETSTCKRGWVSLQEHRQATAGVECRKDEGVIDETPSAYKPIETVMAAQQDLVQVVYTLKQVVCVKG